MRSVGLKLADHKTEAVLFKSRKQVENITIDVEQCTITYQPCIRYLGMMLDTVMRNDGHFKKCHRTLNMTVFVTRYKNDVTTQNLNKKMTVIF